MEKEERQKQEYPQRCNFYLVIILVGLTITSPLPAAFAESGESDAGSGGDDDGGGGDDDGGGGDDDGSGGDDDGGGGDDDSSVEDKEDNEVVQEDKQADVTIEADNVQGLDNTITQNLASFDSTIAIRPGDQPIPDTDTTLRSFMATPPVGTGDPLATPPVGTGDPLATPPVGTGDPLATPPVGTGDPQLNDDSNSISDIKKEVEKTEEILSFEDKEFVDGIINYAKKHVEKDIDEESKLLLTTLTPDETNALVSAQIQFIRYNLPNMGAGTTVPSSTVRDPEPAESMDIKSLLSEQFFFSTDIRVTIIRNRQ
jgi:hypothetical protein